MVRDTMIEGLGGIRNSECWAGHGGGSGGISPDGGTTFIGYVKPKG